MWCSERRRALRLLAALPAAGLAAACGFAPLYGSGAPASRMAGRVDVAPMQGEAGFVLRQRLVDRLGSGGAPTHRLVVDLELDQAGVALTQDNVTTRYDVIGVAAYALTPLGGADVTLSGEVRAITGYSAPDTKTALTFASRAAQRDAERRLALQLADRIVQRLALGAEEWTP